METVKIASIKPNPNNPRIIRDEAFRKLVERIKEYPHFLAKRGIVHANGVILGGNMRYRAIRDALTDEAFREKIGVTSQAEIPAAWVQDASGWSEDDQRAFVIADNAQFGEPDWDILANEWEVGMLKDWEVDLPVFDVEEVEPPDFEPGTEEEQGKLDELSPKIVKCPHCGKEFDSRAQE